MALFGRKKRLTDYASCAGWAGKLPAEGIARVLREFPRVDDPNLIVGIEGSSDAGVYRLRDDLYIVQTLDFFPPLVDDPFTFGQIAAANSLSDVYAMGGQPTTALNIVGFPDDQLDLEVLGEILKGGADKVHEAGAVIAGGHSVRDAEIKYGLSVTGVVTPEELLTNQQAKAGDVLILTKPLGTGFVTTANKMGKCDADTMNQAIANMTQLNRAGAEAAQAGRAHASTDITGFGLAGHAMEMALASEVSLLIETRQLPALPGAKDFAKAGLFTRASASNRDYCQPHLELGSDTDKLGEELAFDAQTSGGLLLSVAADQVEATLAAAQSNGATKACIVGSVHERREKAVVLR